MVRQTVLVLAFGALVSGCASTASAPSPAIAQQPQTRCQQIIDLVRHPWGTPEEKAMAFELGKNEGCFGTPSVNVTVR